MPIHKQLRQRRVPPFLRIAPEKALSASAIVEGRPEVVSPPNDDHQSSSVHSSIGSLSAPSDSLYVCSEEVRKASSEMECDVSNVRIPIGTRVRKYFVRSGWIIGKVTGYDEELESYALAFPRTCAPSKVYSGKKEGYALGEVQLMVRLAEIRVGMRLAIFWDDDDCFYSATVVRLQNRQQKNCCVKYDDGEFEWIDLSKHAFQILESHRSQDEKVDHENEDESLGETLGEDESASPYKSLDQISVAKPLDHGSSHDYSSRDDRKQNSTRDSNTILDENSFHSVFVDKHIQDRISLAPDLNEGSGIFNEKETLGLDTKECSGFQTDNDNINEGNRTPGFKLGSVDCVEKKSSAQIDDKTSNSESVLRRNNADEMRQDTTKSSGASNPDEVESEPRVGGDHDDAIDIFDEFGSDLDENQPDESRSKQNTPNEVLSGPEIDAFHSDNNQTCYQSVQEDDGSGESSHGGTTDAEYQSDDDNDSIDENEDSLKQICDDDSDDESNGSETKEADESKTEIVVVDVGTRLAVFWPGESKYFSGTVTKIRDKEIFKVYIEYDDGDREWINLREHKFRLVKRGRPRKDEAEREKIAVPNATRKLSRSKERKVMAESGTVDGDTTTTTVGSTRKRKRSAERKVLAEAGPDKVNGDIKEITVGSRVEVWWKDDRRYYEGRVTMERVHAKPFYLEYVDGEKEWIDFSQHKFRIVNSNEHCGISDETVENERVAGLKLGVRLDVWWPGEQKYFRCTLTRRRDNKKAHYLEYDDGDKEWLNLNKARFKVLGQDVKTRTLSGKKRSS